MTDGALVTLTIEGVEVQVPAGTMIIEAAKRAGVVIPHYCYHPGLPVAGVCRMCLVEVEGAPKLQIGCATPVAEGQVVKVFSDESLEARKAVLEFLLINHPLDCPICDQAGECELQDFVFQEGRANSRYLEYAKRYSPSEDFGGDVLYVANRCILCTRCVRFMDHVAEDSVLNVSDRGDRAFIGIHPDHGLTHEWAGNVVDLCPVGSLISKDFLHKARVWELDHTASVCTGCSQGCNVTLDTRDNIVVRIRPRANPEVNRYFMCDTGRRLHREMNRGDRLEAPLVAQGDEHVATDWDHAFEAAARLIRGAGGKAVVLASPNTSSEALALARQLVADFDVTAAFRVPRVVGEEPLSGVDDLALREERAANVAGATALGYTEDWDAAVATLSGAALVLVVGDDLDEVSRDELARAGHAIYLGTTLPDAARAATVVFPTTNVAEEDGSYVNRDGRVQRYYQAKTAPGMARPAWWVLSELRQEAGQGNAVSSAEAAFESLSATEPPFAGLTYPMLGVTGRPLGGAEVSA